MSIRIATVLLIGLFSQGRPPDSISFDAASVKQNKSVEAGSYVGRQPGGRFNAQNASLRELIVYAYQLQSFELVGGASWMDSDRWDIVAKLDSTVQPRQSLPTNEALALRTLLSEQFGLKNHRESRDMPIYALVLARTDGKLGPEMKASDIDCKARPCGMRGRIGSMQAVGASLQDFTAALAERVGRPVTDRTGLKGIWEFTLTHAQEASQISPGVLPPGSPVPEVDPSRAPSIFTAIQEQLGLKLESARGPVSVFIVDGANRPIG